MTADQQNWTVRHLDRYARGVVEQAETGATARAAMVLPDEEIQGTAESGRIAAPKILRPSADRVKAECGHYKSCGGCSMMHANDEFTTAWKADLIRKSLAAHDLPFPLTATYVSPLRSRRRVVLSARRTKKSALCGFHMRGSDVITDLSDCRVMRPEIQAALPNFRELTQRGASRSAELSIWIVHGPAGLDVAVTGGKDMTPALFSELATIAEQADFARLSWGDQSITRRPPALPIGGSQVVPPPGAFLQATAEGETALQNAVLEFTEGATSVLDLYAGIGTFTLPLARRARVHAVEGLAAPLEALDHAWRRGEGLSKVTTEVRDLANRPLLADEFTSFNAIVIDPPRAGAEALCHEIAKSSVEKIAFAACDPVNFARDSSILTKSGFHLESLQMIDQFRFSAHVELVASFTRR